MIRRKSLLILVIPGLVASEAALAQTTPTQAPRAEAAPVGGPPVEVQFHGARDGVGRGKAPRGRGGRGGMMRLFEEADADGNGAVTQAEIDAWRAAQVERADTDADGGLSLEEFQTIWQERARPRMVDAFQNLDEDGDGRITDAELDDRFGRIVARLDRDGDGALSPADRGRRNR